MPKLNLSRSIVINAPVEKVYESISDFNHWTTWSPWLIQEPDAKVSVSDDTKYYEWDGSRIGSGNIKITSEEKNKWVNYDLIFLKPWKSKAKVRFEVDSSGDGTEVTWFMDSSLPFFMFWMKKMMLAFIGMDYERGLALLKDYVEDGKVHSTLDFKGLTTYGGCKYIGIKTGCGVDQLETKMTADFTRLWELAGDKINGEAFSIYHKWDMVKRQVKYTAGIPLSSIPENLPEGIIAGELPETKVYKLRHTGPYSHLGNAWITMYNLHRNKVFKLNRKIDPFETYVNDPAEVSDKELITDINFAVK